MALQQLYDSIFQVTPAKTFILKLPCFHYDTLTYCIIDYSKVQILNTNTWISVNILWLWTGSNSECVPPGTSDISENGASSVPDPGGSPQDPGSDHSSKSPETDVPQRHPNSNYTSAVEGSDPKDVQNLDSKGSKSSSVRSNRILALLLLTLVYLLNS